MNISMISIILLLALLCVGCDNNSDDDIQNLNKYVTKDVSKFDKVDTTKFEGMVQAYCAKPAEWFMIEIDHEKYCFVITDQTKILNEKGKKQKHKMFNVGTSDIVEVKAHTQCGSIYEEYNDVKAWLICDSVKILDTLEY